MLKKETLGHMIIRTVTLGVMVFTGLLGLNPTQIQAAETPKEKAISQLLSQSLQGLHYSQVKFEDDYSKRAFNLYIERLDFQKRFFLQSDINELSKLDTYIDDEFTNASFRFFDLASKIYRQRVYDVKRFYKPYLDQNIEMSFPELIETDGEKVKWAKNRVELEDRWKKIIRYELIQEYFNQVDQAEKKASDSGVISPIPVKPHLLKKAQDKVGKSLENLFERIEKLTPEDQYHIYFNAIANSYDPHTSYFAPQNKTDFDISMTGQLEGIGALLREEDDYIKVVRVIPGSAAWRQKELEADDIILKVAEPNQDPVNLVNVRVQDAVKHIRGKKGTPVVLTVKKLNGEVKRIEIVRDVVILEDTFAKGALITDPDTKRKFGYIHLPSFYRDFKDSHARNSTDDVERLLFEMIPHKVSGVILDLRDNGGGALEDAVKMSGLFIKTGPIVQVKNQINMVSVLQDKDPDIAYEGPLAILINENSASASEILAAAMQDYKRAVIIGSDHTFGKGTVQTFVDLDQQLSPFYAKLKPLGSAKITIQKFYRINGDSTQYKGVEPDIVLRNTQDTLERGEKSLDYSLKWDTISPLQYDVWAPTLNLSPLQRRSQQRIQNSLAFKKQQQSIERQIYTKNHTQRSLDLQAAYTYKQQQDKALERIKNMVIPTPDLTVSFIQKETKQLEETTKKLEEWHKEVKKDYIVEETIAILNDLIDNDLIGKTSSNR